jgi:hypothetical protein
MIEMDFMMYSLMAAICAAAIAAGAGKSLRASERVFITIRCATRSKKDIATRQFCAGACFAEWLLCVHGRYAETRHVQKCAVMELAASGLSFCARDIGLVAAMRARPSSTGRS